MQQYYLFQLLLYGLNIKVNKEIGKMQNILIVVDMQNGFARYDQTKNVGKKIINLLEMNIFDYVIATKFVNKKNGPYKDILNWQKLTESPEIDIIKGIKYDIALEKYVLETLSR